MLRAILIALVVAGCSQPSLTSPSKEDASSLAYPADPLPPEVLARLGPGPDRYDYEAVMQLFESAEPEMVRLRRSMTPIIVKIDNEPEDGILWTVLSFHGAMEQNFDSPLFEGRWIARRIRKAWDGQTVIDWADSDQCAGFPAALSAVTEVRPPMIELPERSRATGAKLTVISEREFTLWTTWAPTYDLRFGRNADSAIGQWAIGLAIALQSCWTATEPQTR